MSDDEQSLRILADSVTTRLAAAGLTLATAESCTGGWVAKAITDIPGSSAVLERGFVTYSNQAKHEMLAVAAGTLEAHGAVSEETVIEMALGALRASHAQIALAVSGIAGPTGATVGKPVGTVCFAWATSSGGLARAETCLFSGDRDAIRRQSVRHALGIILEMV